MLRLYVLRHSKAGQTNKRILSDHERTLTKRGVELCEVVAKDLKEQKANIDYVITSTARRCVETQQEVLKHLNFKGKVDSLSSLYLADVREILEQVHKIAPRYRNVMIVGHNPGLHEFCLRLTNITDKKMFKELKSYFSPPSLAIFELKAEKWSDIELGSGNLTHYFRAK